MQITDGNPKTSLTDSFGYRVLDMPLALAHSLVRLSVRLWTFWSLTFVLTCWPAGSIVSLNWSISLECERGCKKLFVLVFFWMSLFVVFPLKKTIVYKCQVLSPCVNFKLVTKNLLCSFVVADSECESLLEAELVPVQLGGGPTRPGSGTNDPPTWPPADRAPCFQVSNPLLHPPAEAEAMMACLTVQKVF